MKQLLTHIIDWFYFPFVARLMSQSMFRYAACGGGNMGFDIFLYFIFYNFILDKTNLDLGFVVISPYIASFLIVFPITFYTGFWLMKNIAFVDSPLKDHTKLFRYMLTVAGTILINYVCLKLFVEVLGIYPTPSKMITTVVTVIFSYFMQRNFTFTAKQH